MMNPLTTMKNWLTAKELPKLDPQQEFNKNYIYFTACALSGVCCGLDLSSYLNDPEKDEYQRLTRINTLASLADDIGYAMAQQMELRRISQLKDLASETH